jgi:class 3 adenylate cyclase
MSSLPRGTVTFLFTDIEGSTDLLKRLGDRYREILTEHRRIVRETFGAADGIEIDTQGDAFFFVFSRAGDALGAAVEVQRAHVAHDWSEGVVVRVRIGLHTGEPAIHEDGYMGLDVVRAARICTAGQGGQILLSEATRALVRSTLPEGVSVFPLGERHLRGIDEPERVYEVAIEGVDDEQVEEPAPVTREERPLSGEQDIERRFEDLGSRLAAGIQEQVLRKLEGAVGKVETPGAAPEGDSSDIDDIAARADSLGEKITARVEAALKAKGISRDDRR